MSTPHRFLELLHLYKTNRISGPELQEFFSLVNLPGHDAEITEQMLSTLKEAGGSEEPGLPAYRAEEIMRVIISAEKEARRLIPENNYRIKRIKWAAVAALLIGFLAYGSYTLISQMQARPRHKFQAIIPKESRQTTNTTNLPMMVLLEDQSRVLLDPGASVSYLPGFSSDKREVYLEGAAFFDIARNARKPFIVYSNKTVIKVLGTSFKVKPDELTHELEVAVVTGKVQVFENKMMVKDSSTDKGIIITPNQRVFYNEEKREFKTTLVEQPRMLADS
jgi:ferric-dicitrate binding protein FerR (iron transport regulator)